MVNWENYDNDTPIFTLNNRLIKGKCVDVYDGDTIKLVLSISLDEDKLYKWNCRINRVDTPELRTKNKLEKEMGYTVRDKLREKIFNKIVTVNCDTFDKYGRLLVEIEIDGENISDWLIKNEYAFKYDGGTKKLWGPYLESKNNTTITNNDNNTSASELQLT